MGLIIREFELYSLSQEIESFIVYCCALKIEKWTKACTIYSGETIPAWEGTAKANINTMQLKSVCENSSDCWEERNMLFGAGCLPKIS